MAAGLMQADAWGDFRITFMIGNATGENMLDHLANMISCEWSIQGLVAHARSRRVDHLGGLQMEARLGIVTQRAGMVVVQVRDDNLFKFGCINADKLESFNRFVGNSTPALCRLGPVKSCVDQDCALLIEFDPNDVVQRVWLIMIIGLEK